MSSLFVPPWRRKSRRRHQLLAYTVMTASVLAYCILRSRGAFVSFQARVAIGSRSSTAPRSTPRFASAETEQAESLMSSNRLLHTMLHVADVNASIDFYEQYGMRVLSYSQRANGAATAFVGFGEYKDAENFALELAAAKPAADGTREKIDLGDGFQHLALANMGGMGAGEDPDGYVVKLEDQVPSGDSFCSLCLRVSNMKKSTDFYSAVLGMTASQQTSSDNCESCMLRFATSDIPSSKSGGGKPTSISSAQADDISGVVSRTMMIPGVPDWVKLGVAKQGVNGIADAVNSGVLPPELQDGLLSAMGGDGLLSERLADQIVDVLAPKIDIPLVSEAQKKEVLKQAVQSMLVQKEEDNAFLGVAQQSATFATVQGGSMIRAMSQLRSDESKTALAEELAADIEITDFLGEENEKLFMRSAVDALGEVILTKVPPEAIEAAVNAGEESSVEEFLCTIVGKEINVPFASDEQKQDMARSVIRGWLGTVDKDALAKEQDEAEVQRAKNKAEREQLLNVAAKPSPKGVRKLAGKAAGFVGGFMNSLMGKSKAKKDEGTGSSASSSKKDRLPAALKLVSEGNAPVSIGKGFDHLVMSTPDVKLAAKSLEAAGVKVTLPPTVMFGMNITGTKDPDGYSIFLVEEAGFRSR